MRPRCRAPAVDPPTTPAAIEIRPLTPPLLGDVLDVFEQRTFVDPPRWRPCHCHFPQADHARIAWKDHSATQNRAAGRRRSPRPGGRA